MSSQINTLIIDYIIESEFEENIKSFLIKALNLEYDKQEREVLRFTEDYKKLVDKFYEG